MTKVSLTALALLLPAASALAHGDHAASGPYAHPLMHLAPGAGLDWLAIAAIGFAIAAAPWLLAWLRASSGRVRSGR